MTKVQERTDLQLHLLGGKDVRGGLRPRSFAQDDVRKPLVLERSRQRLAVTNLCQALHTRPLKLLAEMTPGLYAVHWASPIVRTRRYHMRIHKPVSFSFPIQNLQQKWEDQDDLLCSICECFARVESPYPLLILRLRVRIRIRILPCYRQSVLHKLY